ncbi:MAG: histidine triad nucleotide-binding protein [Methylococcaceae bacterium]
MTSCIFCKMVSGEIKPKVILENDHILAFHDINPKAPVHALVIPKAHISTLDDLPSDDPELASALFQAVQQVAAALGVSETGYRTVINCRGDSGQEVYHLHLHILGGRTLGWPPG